MPVLHTFLCHYQYAVSFLIKNELFVLYCALFFVTLRVFYRQ